MKHARILPGQVHITYPAWNAHALFEGYKRSVDGREYGRPGGVSRNDGHP